MGLGVAGNRRPWLTLCCDRDHLQLPPGETLYHEGDMGENMYFLQRGDVQLSMLLVSDKIKQVGSS